MSRYLSNVLAWLRGFRRTGDIKFKPGWSANWRWFLLYTIDYGTHVVLTGAAVVSWSRWFYEKRRKYRLAAFMNRLLRHLDDQHGENSGPVLWATEDCSWPMRCAVTVGWALLIWWAL